MRTLSAPCRCACPVSPSSTNSLLLVNGEAPSPGQSQTPVFRIPVPGYRDTSPLLSLLHPQPFPSQGLSSHWRFSKSISAMRGLAKVTYALLVAQLFLTHGAYAAWLLWHPALRAMPSCRCCLVSRGRATLRPSLRSWGSLPGHLLGTPPGTVPGPISSFLLWAHWHPGFHPQPSLLSWAPDPHDPLNPELGHLKVWLAPPAQLQSWPSIPFLSALWPLAQFMTPATLLDQPQIWGPLWLCLPPYILAIIKPHQVCFLKQLWALHPSVQPPGPPSVTSPMVLPSPHSPSTWSQGLSLA